VNDSLRPRASNIGVMLGIALPVLTFSGGLIKAYSDMSVDRATRAYVDTQHDNALAKLSGDVESIKADNALASEMSKMREQQARMQETIENLREDVRDLKRRR
jgi:hypothetical protein